MNEHQLRTRMELLGAGAATADWADARKRAERLLRRRTRLAVAAVAAAAVVAVPAIGLATGEIDFWSAEPAHPRVVLLFESMDRHRPAGAEPYEIRDARKILTRTFPDGLLTKGTWTLTVGLRKDGGFCTFIEGPRGGGAQCAGGGRRGALEVMRSGVDDLSDGIVYGAVRHREAAYVEIVFRGGRFKRTELTWVSKPIDAAFFMEQLPVSGQLGTVVVRDADGARLLSSQH